MKQTNMTRKINSVILLAVTIGLLLGLAAYLKPWPAMQNSSGNQPSLNPIAGYQGDSNPQSEQIQQIYAQLHLLQQANTKLETQQMELLKNLTELQNHYLQSQQEYLQLQKQLLVANEATASDNSLTVSSQNMLTDSGVLKSSSHSIAAIEKVAEFNDSLAEKRITVMEDALIEQDYDSSWSTAANDQIYNTADTEQFGGSSIMVSDCKSSLCVIDVSHDDHINQQYFLDHFPGALGWKDSSGQYQILKSNNEFLTRFYITRGGYDLPPDIN